MLALATVSLAVLAACGTPTDSGLPSSPGSGSGRTSGSTDGCPPIPISSDAPYAAVDFVDFVHWRGVTYIASLDGPLTATTEDIGTELFRVTCSYSELNERTNRQPPDPVDLSAGFLTAGTPVHALKGWAPECRLTAEREGAWQVYLATVSGAPTVTVAPCATAPSGSPTS